MSVGAVARRRLLLVDDDAASRMVLALLLEDAGFVVTQAKSLADAIARVAADAPYAAVVVDNQLGDGFGVQLVPHVRAAWPDAKILSLSGTPRLAAIGTPFDGHVTKGESFPLLVEAIEALVTAPER